jgi:hypothetical protein
MGQVFAEFTKIMIYEATIHQTATGIKILG